MARSKHEHKELFSSSVSLHERKKLHQQFTENLRSILYNPEKMLEALNFRSSITINGEAHQNLTMEDLTNAFNDLQKNYITTYDINPQINTDETLRRSGLSYDEINALSISIKLFYDAALYYALDSVLSPTPKDSITGKITFIYHKLIDKKERSESQCANLESSLISSARHIFREHQEFTSCYGDFNALSKQNFTYESMYSIAAQIFNDIEEMAKTPKGYSNPEWMTKVLKTCCNAIQNPSIEAAIECEKLSKQADSRSLPSTIKNSLMALAGIVLIFTSILLSVETLGLASPISAMGISMGSSALAVSAGASAVTGICGSVTGTNCFFQGMQKSSLSTDLDVLGSKIDAYNVLMG